MPMFTEIDYFLKNWWHTECLQTSRTEKWTEHFHTFIANKALHSHLIKTLFFSWHRISIYTCYLNAIYMLIHVSDLISMKKILPLPLIDIIDNLFRISTNSVLPKTEIMYFQKQRLSLPQFSKILYEVHTHNTWKKSL